MNLGREYILPTKKFHQFSNHSKNYFLKKNSVQLKIDQFYFIIKFLFYAQYIMSITCPIFTQKYQFLNQL